MMKRLGFPLILFLLSLTITSAHLIAIEKNLYWRYLWFDNPMHFAGGLLIGLIALWGIYESGLIKKGKGAFNKKDAYIAAFLSTMIIGLLWEAFEFSLEQMFVLDNNDLGDTLLDLIMDAAGALFAAYLYIVFRNRKKGRLLADEI